jgi:dihydroneopterin aldolase
MRTLDIIKLHNAVFYAYHGALTDEQTLGGKFEVDVELHCDLTTAKETDDLKQTVNYEQVYSLMKRIVTEKKYYLIEALAHSIGQGILAGFRRCSLRSSVFGSPALPIHGVVDTIEVHIESHR